MKRIITIILTCALLLILPGCTTRSSGEKDPLAEWLENARLDAPDMPGDLYAAAQSEGMLIVYSTSTRMMDAAESFEREYPGLMVRVEHIREGELYGRLTENYETGNYACDVVCSADGRGIMSNEFIPKKIVVKYVPYDMEDKIIPGNNDDQLTLAGEAAVFTYNEKYYPQPPVNNWWELTEEAWRGMIYIPNPARSMTTLAFFATIIENSDLMAKAYEDLYGQPLVLPAGENAGREFVRRFIDNGVVILNSSDETAEEIGMPGSNSPNVGIMVSSKTRLREIGYEMVNHYDMKPFCGVYTPISIMIAGGSKNINTAKLFVRWLLGEANGDGEGYKPYLKSGAWSVRSDVADDTGVRPDGLDLLYVSKSYLYESYDSTLSFWEELITGR